MNDEIKEIVRNILPYILACMFGIAILLFLLTIIGVFGYE